MKEYPYVFPWKNNSKRLQLYGKRFRVIKRLKMNSAAVEFEDKTIEIISRNAIRRAA